ncbi:MAG TPA: phage protein [Polyangia bacterium]|jgi:Protein of unknown function (DUF3277).|nr:phage protein [Polyangia bacterium]
MSRQLSTYSAKDLNFAFSHPYIGVIQASGVSERGIDQVLVRMSTTQTTIQIAADGATVPSAIPGDNGEIEIQVWQTSEIHRELLAWYNACKTARDSGDVSEWASGSMLVENIIDGSLHRATGVAPQKVPDKTYQKEAQRVSWVLMACNISNE